MLDPGQLLNVARELADAGKIANRLIPIFDAHLRRAISTAYYAVFHTITRAAAEHFLGRGALATPASTIIRRGFDHGRIRQVCDELSKPTLKKIYQEQLRRSAMSQDARYFAGAFAALQDRRHLADYDPSATFYFADADALVASAADAIDAFDRIPHDERRDLLALMLVRTRG